MIQPQDIQLMLAETYFEAAKAGKADMRKVAEMLEALRPHFSEQPEYDIWKYVRLAGEDTETLLPLLVKLKYAYLDLIFKAGSEQIKTAVAEDSDEGFTHWLRFYTEAVLHWESHVYDRIDDLDFGFSGAEKEYLATAQQYHDRVRDNRWGDCYERYKNLAENLRLLPRQQAWMELICGQIALYHLLDMSLARIHFDKARSLQPNPDARVERCMGEWKLKNQEFDASRLHFMNAMAIDVNDSEHYIAMGDSYRDERRWKLAEDYYLQAIAHNALETSPYERLIYIYGEPEMFAENEDKLSGLLDKIETLNLPINDKRYGNWRYNAWRAMGWIMQRNERMDDAEKWYKKAADTQPKWMSAWLDLGNFHYAKNQLDEAGKFYEKAVEATPDSYDACWSLAWFREQQGDYVQAASGYENCIQLRPAAAVTIGLTLADLYSNQLENPDKALELLLQLKEKAPEHAGVYTRLAGVYHQLNQEESVEEMWRKALEFDPANDNTWNEVGIIHYRREAYAQAAECFEKTIAINPNNATYYGNLADAWTNIGAIEKVSDLLTNALEKIPENADLYNRMGNVFYRSGDYDKAIQYYQKTVSLDDSNAVYTGNLAGAYKQIGELENADKCYGATLDIDPDSDFYQNEAGIVKFQLQEYAAAAEHFGKAAALKQTDPVYYDNLAQAFQMVPGQEEAAEAAYLKAISIAHDNPEFHNRLGNLYVSTGDFPEAKQAYTAAVALDPANAIFKANEGYAASLSGDYDTALQALEAAVKLNPDIPQIHIWRAQVMTLAGQTTPAASYLIELMRQHDEPAFLEVFLEIFNTLEDDSMAKEALPVVESQPAIYARYKELL